MSAPAAKAFSLPARTMAAIAGSPSRSSRAAPSSAISAAFKALSACGRLRVTIPTGPCRSRRMLAYAVLLMNDLLPTLSVAPDYGDDNDRGSKDYFARPENRGNWRRRIAIPQGATPPGNAGVALDEFLIA